jgi:hypothetical protein
LSLLCERFGERCKQRLKTASLCCYDKTIKASTQYP